MDSIF